MIITYVFFKPESLKQLLRYYEQDETLTDNPLGSSKGSGPAIKIPAKTAIKRASLRTKGKYKCLKESHLSRK